MKRIKIAVSGSTGSHANSICNSIVGEELLEDNDEILTHKDSTDDVNGVSVTVERIEAFDDARHNIDDYHQALRGLSSTTFDIFLYCIELSSDTPMLEEDKRSFDELERLMHPNVLGSCIVVLTHADSIVLNGQTRLNTSKVTNRIIREYKQAIANWTGAIHRYFRPNLTVITAGSSHCFSILNNEESWLSVLFHAVIESTNEEAKGCLLQKNRFRLIMKQGLNKDDLKRRHSYEHPIIIGENSTTIKEKLKEMAAGLGAGGAAGLTGATVGALIGALAIGVPSFGIAAGIGLGLGAAVGGGIGVGTGVTVTKAVSRKKRKEEAEKDEGLV